jgi:XTP/dITP diphosphohydrolase
MARLFLCSSNHHKVDELSAMLGPTVNVMTPTALAVDAKVVEDASTFAGNALKKARQGHQVSGLVTLADDSGLCVDALQGQPGVRSARFAEDHNEGRGDAANNTLLLRKLEGVPDHARKAQFVCVVALVDVNGQEQLFRGELGGRIARQERGRHGFGYDPLFELPDGRALAMLEPAEKNALSHRACALAHARPAIASALKDAERRRP